MTTASLWASEQRAGKKLHGRSRPSVWSCWGRLVYIHRQKQQQSYTSLCRRTAVQQSEKHKTDQRHPTEGLIWLTIQTQPCLLEHPATDRLAPRFASMLSSSRHPQTCDSVPTLTSRRGWHFIIGKLKKKKRNSFVLFFSIAKRSQEAATQCSVSTPQKKNVSL